MTKYLSRWLQEDKLKKHSASIDELLKLFKIVDRDLADASIQGLSADRCFITAYNAVLQLATIVLRAYGLRTNPNKAGHHRISIDALPEILGSEFQDLTGYFDACRIKRHNSDYTSSGEVSTKEATELLKEAKEFKKSFFKWLKDTYPDLAKNLSWVENSIVYP